jgi:TPP-dependent pyruvate/acetoin dehydrogenase alpha subunit
MPVPEREHAIGLYRRMRLIRGFEELIQDLFMKGEVHGTTHLYIGEEACAVGVADVLTDADRVAGTYRGHGHALALGVDPQALLDEMLGRASGVCGGRAGSMNVIDVSGRLIGCFGIIGGSIAAATGAALALRTEGGVAAAFFGEGTTNHGYFHECLNLAQVMGLPVVYVCENNRYGEFTPFEDVTAGSIIDRPRALGLECEQVDGMDVFAVREAAGAAVDRARAGGGPQFLELLTYRFVGHSRADPGRYRKPGELEQWRERDPLVVAGEHLAAAHEVDSADLVLIDQEIDALLAQMRAEGLSAPMPDPSVLATASEFKESS